MSALHKVSFLLTLSLQPRREHQSLQENLNMIDDSEVKYISNG